MQNGLYRLHFTTPIGEGAGVIVADAGSIKGGDSLIYYLGNFSEDGDNISADVDFAFHSKIPGAQSVFGVDQGSIALTGKSTGNSAQLSGTSPQAPGIKLQCALTLLAN